MFISATAFKWRHAGNYRDPKGLFSQSWAAWLISGRPSGVRAVMRSVKQDRLTEANRGRVAKGAALSSICECSTICLRFWWAEQHLRKGLTSSRLQLRVWRTSADDIHYVKCPRPSFLLTSASHQFLSLILRQKHLASCPRATGCFLERGWANWPCLDTWCKDEETFWCFCTDVRQTEWEKEKHIKGKCSFPYMQFFLNLDKYEGLWGQDATESDSEDTLNVWLRVWQQVRPTRTSLTCLEWMFEFSPAVFLQPVKVSALLTATMFSHRRRFSRPDMATSLTESKISGRMDGTEAAQWQVKKRDSVSVTSEETGSPKPRFGFSSQSFLEADI